MLPRAVAQMPTLLAHAQSRFLIAWIIPFWLLIELIPTKLPHYPLPVFPALAVLLVCAVEVPLPGNLGGGKLSHKIQRYIALAGEYLMLAVVGVLAAVVLWARGFAALAILLLRCACSCFSRLCLLHFLPPRARWCPMRWGQTRHSKAVPPSA